MDPGLAGFRQFLIVLTKPPSPAQPCQCPLYHPPSFGATPRSDGCPGCGATQSAAIRRWTKPTPPTGPRRLRRPRCPEPGKPAQQFGQHQHDSIPVLDVGGVNHSCQEQSHGVHYDVSLVSRYPFTCAIASSLPFSVVLTDWLSMKANWRWHPSPRSPGPWAVAPPPPVPKWHWFATYGNTTRPCPKGGSSWRIIRQGMSPRNTYRMLLITSRWLTVRGCPLEESGGSKVSSNSHSESVKSVGYAFRS